MFRLSFQNKTDRTVHTGYYLWNVEIKDYNVMIDAMTFLINLFKIILEFMKFFKNCYWSRGDYIVSCLLDYPY